MQKFIENQLGGFAEELAQLDQAAQQFKPQPPMPPDSSLQVAQIRTQVDQAKLAETSKYNQAKLAQDAQLAQAKMAVDEQARSERLQAEQIKQAGEDQRLAADLQTRERMNTADNDTAKLLAAAEMATGEKVAYSTGTGINPNP